MFAAWQNYGQTMAKVKLFILFQSLGNKRLGEGHTDTSRKITLFPYR